MSKREETAKMNKTDQPLDPQVVELLAALKREAEIRDRYAAATPALNAEALGLDDDDAAAILKHLNEGGSK